MEAVAVRVFASHPIVRAQFVRLLSAASDLRIVVEGEEAHVGIFDGEANSLEAALTLARLRHPLMKPLLVSSMTDESECLGWMLRGVWGIVAYDSYEDVLCRAVRTLAEGQLWLPGSLVFQKMRIDRHFAAPSHSSTLTEREQEVLGLLYRRLSNKEIATILRISVRTAKFHVGNILHKLNVSDREKLWTSLAPGMISPVPPVLRPVP
ncbi:MAG: response regulator transcription factor [Terriglobia bacterium]